MNMKLWLILPLLVSTLLHAELKIGEPFPKLKLQDQFDVKMQVPVKGNIIIFFSSEKKISQQVDKFIDFKGKGFLEENHIVYISDISGMPSIITKLFAKPKMKKFKFKIALIYDEKTGALLSKQKGKVTVITLEDNRVKDIKFIKPTGLFALFK